MPKVRRDPFRTTIVGPAYMHGGTEQHTLTLTKFTDPRRICFTQVLITNADLWDRDAVQPHCCAVAHCPPEDLERRTRNADCVLSWGIDLDRWLCPLADRARIHVAHGAAEWSQKIVAGCAATVDHIICVSKHVADVLQFTTPHTIIPNGIDTSRLTETATAEENRAVFGFEDTDHVIGYLGRLTADKNVNQIVSALEILPAHVKALIIGGGEEQAQLEHLAEKIAPNRVVFVETETYLGDVFGCMDSFVMPSAHEGFCLAAAEAMWSGVPIVMTDVGLAADDIEHEVNGLIIRPSAESIAEAVYKLVKHPYNGRMMAHRARTIAQTKYQARRMAAEYTALIENVIESKVPKSTPEAIPY